METMRGLFFLFTFLISISVNAEYRVFRLVLKDSETKTQREFLSTLDPFQYVFFYPIKPTESLDYTDTWRCFEDTSNREYCPSPRAKNTLEDPNSSPLK
jgi:hypothetical protein